MSAAAPAVAGPSNASPEAMRVALVGNPNCGKTALFNLLTGSRQKVANYPGVTVDRKEGQLTTPAGRQFRLLDLPGAQQHAPSAGARVTLAGAICVYLYLVQTVFLLS